MKRLALLAAFLAVAPIPVALAAQQPPPAARYEHALSPQAISAVQQRLREEGFYRGRIDGVWGRGTQAALARFQESRRLEVTAQLNPATAKALDLRPDQVLGNVVNMRQAYREPPPAAPSLSVDSLAAVQHRLRNAGY